MTTFGVGIVGSGNISDVYILNAPLFRGMKIVAVSDIRPAVAKAKGAKYDLPALSPRELLKREDIDIVLNLTVPAAHADVSLAAIDAGKHVYTEKPLATSLKDGRAIVRAAARKGVTLGASPDTVLGAGVQTARKLIDSGETGAIVTGTAAVLSHGMENWHPSPTFFFKPGGGPVLDMGPYYLSTLVNLLGPVESVAASGRSSMKMRTVTAEGPMQGRHIKVEVLTTVNALLSFASGADIVFMASWDVWRHSQPPLELHGTNVSLRLPDPNFFGGGIDIAERGGEWSEIRTAENVFGRPNWPPDNPAVANYRGLGLAEMAAAIVHRREPRASGAVALHVLDVMASILASAETGRRVRIASTCRRPPALSEEDALALISRKE
ncbi:MAG: Gfo/Idh/MocA family protein [Hyphomicrobiales bacterium]